MTFKHDISKIRTIPRLAQFLGLEEDVLGAVLNFVPPPPTPGVPVPVAAPDTPAPISPTYGLRAPEPGIATLSIPLFVRHEIPKRNKARGKRVVWEPLLLKGHYKQLARRLDSFLRLKLAGYPHPAAFGYLPGRSIRQNAAAHAGARNLLRVDIENFFPSITSRRLEALFQGLGIEEDVANVLARLVTIEGTMPMGFPTSPVLSNAVCIGLDRDLEAMAAAHGATYTRYADDITFSAPQALPAIEDVRRAITAHGFVLAEDKTSRSVRGQAHYVTGLSVSDPAAPHVPKARKRRLRQELYYARKFGLADHLRHQGINDPRVIQQSVNRLDGTVKYVAHHEPELRRRLREIWRGVLGAAGMRPAFRPKNQARMPFFIFVDEAEYVRDGRRLLALGMAVTQHADILLRAGQEVLEASTMDVFEAGDHEAIVRNGLHFTDANEDLRLAYVKRLASLPFEAYVAIAPLEDSADYQQVYLRLLGVMISRRLMASESRSAALYFEQNPKVERRAIHGLVQQAYEELKARGYRHPRSIEIGFVSKPHAAMSAADFVLGTLGRYLRSTPAPAGKPEPRDRLMFERLRDKVRLILDVETWTEYSRRRPIRPWSEETPSAVRGRPAGP